MQSAEEIKRGPLWPFVLLVGLLGVVAVAVVYLMGFNGPPIRSDGLGYYLYLPGIFIFHDPGLTSVAAFFKSGVQPAASPDLWRYSGPDLWRETGQYLIKYPLGEALLLSPFFFLACLLALLGLSPLDGFSPVFQYLAALSGLCYALLGIAVLGRVLERHFSRRAVLLALTAIVFGTGFFHYATYDSLFSHVYSFFLFSALLYTVQRLYREGSAARFLVAGALAGLIVVTRPTNVLWLIVALLYGVDSVEALKGRLAFFGQHVPRVLLALLPFAFVLSLQLFYWKGVSGHWVVFSYQGEGFNFLHPQILNVLFSVRKGLFFWAPVLLTVFPGLFYLKRRAPEYFLPFLVFLPLNVYVISSWHSWFYGGSFGHRAFIDSFPLFAACYCALYDGISQRGRTALTGATVVCVALCGWLMLKYWTGVIPYDETTWDYFVNTFFILSPR